jgi:hypothetical protein
MKSEVCLTKSSTKLKGIRSDLVFKYHNDLRQRRDQLIVVDIVDQFEVGPDDITEAWRDKLFSLFMIKELDQGHSGIHAHRQVVVSQILVESV